MFVYGTLRPGRHNWPVLAPLCHEHEPALLPGYALFDLDHPGVVPLDRLPATDGGRWLDDDAPLATIDLEVGSPGEPTGVRGDLIWLAPDHIREALDRLDEFEGYEVGAPERSYYRRALRRVVPVQGAPCAAWVYLPGLKLLGQVRPDRRVPGDDWPA